MIECISVACVENVAKCTTETVQMATETFFREVEIPEQKSHGDRVLFPVVLSPNTNTKEANMCVFEEAIKAEKRWLESLLNQRGVILFRGFPVTCPSDFNKVVEAFGYPEFVYFGGRAPRTKIVGRVYTANESPLDIRIPFHHEMAYLPDFPKKVFFYCEEEPGEGGETPIVLSHIVYERMNEKHPDFLAQLEEHGLTYITITGAEDDPSVIGGIGWKTAFMTDDKEVAEERAAKLGAKLEWTEKGVKMTTGPLTAIRIHKETQRKTWFYNHGFSNIRPSNINDHATYLELGNGDLVPDDAIKDCLKIMDEECVAIPWKKGDVMLINNFTALHGRLPLRKPPRRVLASLCK